MSNHIRRANVEDSICGGGWVDPIRGRDQQRAVASCRECINGYDKELSAERDGNLGEVIDRRVQVYGDPVTGFAEIATMWSVLFDVEVPAWKVPIAQALMKVVRMKNSPDYSDHSDDIDGYLDIFRKIIGPDMIHARTVNEYIEKKWGKPVTAEDFDLGDVQRLEQALHVEGCIGDHGQDMPCQVAGVLRRRSGVDSPVDR